MDQISLPFTLNSKMLLSNFVGKQNKQLIDFINSLFDNSASAVVYVSGGKSLGKTHVLQGCAFAALDKGMQVAYIDFKQGIPSTYIENIDTNDCICIDNIDMANTYEQELLFDLYNRIKDTSKKLVVSAQDVPNNINILKDLKTRLSLAFVFALESINDEQKLDILNSKIQEKNITINKKVFEFLLNNYSRDLSILLEAIDSLDKSSLQQKKPITIPFVKQQLKI